MVCPEDLLWSDQFLQEDWLLEGIHITISSLDAAAAVDDRTCRLKDMVFIDAQTFKKIEG